MSAALPPELNLIDEPGLPGDAAPAEPGPPGPWAALYRYIPALDALRHYSWVTFRADALAGLTVAAVAVPQAMAYAFIAGIPPQYGLYTAIVMTTVGALFCSSKQLINGPTNAISIAVLSALAPIPDPNDKIQAAVMLALLVGIIQTGITLFRLGDLTRYISHAVVIGFTVGASVLLVLDQTKHLLGLHARGGGEDPFLERFWLTITQGGGIHGWTPVIGLGTILLVLGLRWLNHWLRARIVPELLAAVVIMASVVWAGNLDRQGDVPVVGEIPSSLPAFAIPTLDGSHLRHLSSSALAISLLGLLEAIAMAKAIAARTGQRLDINQQCLSEGLANLTGSFFQCYPGSGSLTRSAINQQAGALTQWAGVFSAVAVAAVMLLFAPLAQYIPRAALAGILMVTAAGMVDRRQLLHHLRATRYDKGMVLATAVAVFISVDFCILIGVFLSFVFYVPRAARIHMDELTLTPERVIRERVPEDPRCSRIHIYDLEGDLFFGSAPDFERHLSHIEKCAGADTRVVVLRLKRARNPDGVCLGLLDDFLKNMAARQIVVLLCGVRDDMANGLRNTGLAARLGPQRIFREHVAVGSSTLDAVRAAYDLLAGDHCATCPRRNEAAGAQPDWYYMI